MPMDTALIVTAAGSSTRMRGGVRKPFLDLGGKTILRVTVERFAPVGRICQVIVTLNRDDLGRKDELLRLDVAPAITDVVAGGATRTDSVANALAALDERAQIVLIHDAVRPFVKREVIEGVIAAAEAAGAAIAACPVKDTLKRSEGGLIRETVPREELFCAQTPQGFRREVIEKAYRMRAGRDFTDDALLVEAMGGRVAVVESGYDNFKITTQEDLEMARAIFLSRDKGVTST